jgi:hypothetical protein
MSEQIRDRKLPEPGRGSERKKMSPSFGLTWELDRSAEFFQELVAQAVETAIGHDE